ncbi:MAG TPA: hypothetical protein VD766_09875, partial [Solirubrobacterales bacterium]|nr:hypothetical protein [Solirubrobacterales bacterium]
AGVPGCRVRAYTPSGSLVTRWSDTDEDGWFDVGGLTKGAYYLAVGAGTCGISPTDLHFDAGQPSRLTGNAALADPLSVALGVATPVPGDLVITQLRNLAPPLVEGAPRAGQPLSANPGTWVPSGANFAYRWYADGLLVPGEQGQAYTPGASQVGKRIRVRVFASKAGYTDAGRTSASTARVAP